MEGDWAHQELKEFAKLKWARSQLSTTELKDSELLVRVVQNFTSGEASHTASNRTLNAPPLRISAVSVDTAPASASTATEGRVAVLEYTVMGAVVVAC